MSCSSSKLERTFNSSRTIKWQRFIYLRNMHTLWLWCRRTRQRKGERWLERKSQLKFTQRIVYSNNFLRKVPFFPFLPLKLELKRLFSCVFLIFCSEPRRLNIFYGWYYTSYNKEINTCLSTALNREREEIEDEDDLFPDFHLFSIIKHVSSMQ